MKKRHIPAFTVAELIITTVMMAVILVIAPVVLVKKAVKPKRSESQDAIAKCKGKCIYNANNDILITENGSEKCIDYNRKTGGWYTVTLIGGGGGGSNIKRGCNGSENEISLMSLYRNKKNNDENNSENNDEIDGILTGYYLLEAGKGGEKGNNGKDSVICVITESEATSNFSSLSCNDKMENDKIKILAVAEGGITSNEGEDCDQNYKNPFTIGGEVGIGGEANGKGKGGIIEIK